MSQRDKLHGVTWGEQGAATRVSLRLLVYLSDNKKTLGEKCLLGFPSSLPKLIHTVLLANPNIEKQFPI